MKEIRYCIYNSDINYDVEVAGILLKLILVHLLLKKYKKMSANTKQSVIK